MCVCVCVCVCVYMCVWGVGGWGGRVCACVATKDAKCTKMVGTGSVEQTAWPTFNPPPPPPPATPPAERSKPDTADCVHVLLARNFIL